MEEIRINSKISYIKASANPLSADIGIIKTCGNTWLYDVGSGEKSISGLNGSYNVVLSHFHKDHAGNIDRIRAKALYVSKETYRHVRRGIVVSSDIYTDGLRIFPLPSSHAKGCLGLEVDETYAFVGDALYCRPKGGLYVYNTQLLKEEIEALSRLKASWLLASHFEGLVREKDKVIDELKAIYAKRDINSPYIRVSFES
ncbi:MAG: hypothetical protein ACOYIT_00375 [Christensenellales bacterium]|jgi:glyoxylase-like metal-dependent hydrolase (beta-lactamase superfamily II)